MPLEFDQNSLIGDLVPDVLIKKITLTTGASTQLGRGKDPHVNIPDPSELPDDLKDLYEGIYEDVEIDPAALATGQGDFSEVEDVQIVKDKPTQIIVDMVIKDTLDNNFLTNWFDNIDFSKFIKIRLVQSTNQAISEAFANGTQSILNSNLLQVPNIGLEIRDISLLNDSDGGMTAVLQSPDGLVNKEVELDKFLEDVNTNGKKTYDIQFSTEFEFPTTLLEHLTYFAQTYIDPVALAASFDPPLTELSPFAEFVGRQIVEPVLLRGNVSDTSDVYVDAKERVWLGPVSEEPDGRVLKGKERPSGLSEQQLVDGLYYVTKRVVPNIKIHDFRDIDSIESLDFDFTSLEERLLQDATAIKFTTERTLEPNYNDVFSELWISRDESNNARMAFGINLERLLKQHSQLFRVYENLPGFTRTNLLNAIKLKNFKMFRSRVTPSGDLFDKDSPKTLVVEDLGNVTDEGVLLPLNLKLGGFKHFQAIDRMMHKESGGLWKYEISFDFEDTLPQFLSEQLEELKLSSKGINEFYLDALLPRNYSVATDTYKVNYIESASETYEDNILPLVSKYFEVIQYLSGPIPNFNNVVRTFSLLLHPRTGSPKGFQTILKLLGNLQDKLSRIIDGMVVNTKVQHVGGIAIKGGSNKGKSKTARIKYEFKETFDASPEIGTGYEFIFEQQPAVDDNLLGMIITSYDTYRDRVEKETARYFNSTNPDIEISDATVTYNVGDSVETSIYSHLSPARMLFATQPDINQLESGIATDQTYNLYMAEILDYNNEDIFSFPRSFATTKAKLGEKEQRLQRKLETVLGGAGMTLAPRKSRVEEIEKNSGITFSDPESKGKANNEEPEFLADINNALLTLVGFNELDLQNKSINDFNLNAPGTQEKMTELAAAAFLAAILGKSFDPVKELPNQIKQLFLSFTKPNVVNPLFDTSTEVVKQGDKYFRMFMLYFNLVQVEYLDSYETVDTGKLAIKSPVWNVLTPSVFEESRDNGRILLCRIKPYENKTFNIKPDKKLRLPILNEYFVMKNPDVSEEVLNIIEVEDPTVDFEESSKPIQQAINDYKPSGLNSNGANKLL